MAEPYPDARRLTKTESLPPTSRRCYGFRMNPVPFGGVKKSSTDSFKEQGAGAIDFYTRIKTVYLDYSA